MARATIATAVFKARTGLFRAALGSSFPGAHG